MLCVGPFITLFPEHRKTAFPRQFFLFCKRLTCCCWGCFHVCHDYWEGPAHFLSTQRHTDGGQKTAFPITAIKSVQWGSARGVEESRHLLTTRAGELPEGEVECMIPTLLNLQQYQIPDWFLKGGKQSQVLANSLDRKLCEDREWLKKIWAHEGCVASGELVSESSPARPQAAGCTRGVSEKKKICRLCLLIVYMP